MRHELKLNTTYFEEAIKGRKPFEVRYNDRDYKVGDEIVLKEYDGVYTGREISGKITYILDQFIGLIPGFIAFTYETESKKDWIPVSERLPDNEDYVLCWYEYYRFGSYNRMYQTYGLGYYIKQYDMWGGEVNQGQKCRVIAWQPLPEPFKEEV